MAETAKVPVTMLSGFLGSGKTTLLRYLLENSKEKIACIVNDVASINIDAKLVRNDRNRARGDQVNSTADLADTIELQNGCACCNLQDELFASFEQVLALAEKRGEPYARIVLENSGVAEPQNIRDKFNEAIANGHPLMSRIELDTLVTVVDSGTFIKDYASRAPLASRPELGDGGNLRPVVDLLVEQIECADFVVLNKTDMLPAAGSPDAPGGLDQLIAIVSSLNPLAAVFSCQQGKVPIDKVFGKTAHAVVAKLNVEGQHRGAVAAARAMQQQEEEAAKKKHSHHHHEHKHDHKHEHKHGECKACEHDHEHGHHDHEHGHHEHHKHSHEEDGKEHEGCTACAHEHEHGHAHKHEHKHGECKACEHDHEHGHHDHAHGHDHEHHKHSHEEDGKEHEGCKACEHEHEHHHHHDHSDCAACRSGEGEHHHHHHEHEHAKPETRAAARFGIKSFVYSRRRPFHPQRLKEMVLKWLPVTHNQAIDGEAPNLGDSPVKSVLRSKGFMWMSNSHTTAYYWSHAGQHFEIRDEGDWWAAVPGEDWPADDAQVQVILQDFDTASDFGDRRQEIVFIGVGMDEAKICEQMDGALLTDDELAKYVARWASVPDPEHPTLSKKRKSDSAAEAH